MVISPGSGRGQFRSGVGRLKEFVQAFPSDVDAGAYAGAGRCKKGFTSSGRSVK